MAECRRSLRLLRQKFPEVSVMDLPDELLLLVFGSLDWRDLLLGVRAVCRRWRDLVQQPALWAGRLLTVHPDADWWDAVKAIALLRLAPALGRLELDVTTPLSHAVLGAATQSSCAVREMSLHFPDSSEVTLSVVRQVLRRQVSLGQLRALTLDLRGDEMAELLLPELWHAGLEHLDLTFQLGNASSWFEAPPETPRGGATLRRLLFDCEEHEPLLDRLLEAHASTLRTVLLPLSATSYSMKLLSRCALLERAQVPVVLDADLLVRCTRLRELYVVLSESPAPLKGLLAAVAPRLVLLSFGPFDLLEGPLSADRFAGVAELLTAMGGCASVVLRELRFTVPLQPQHLEALPRLLVRLPALLRLHLSDVPPREVLERLAPRLRVLSFAAAVAWSRECSVERCSLRALRDLVRVHPQLHVAGVPARHPCGRWDDTDPCDCCDAELHAQSDVYELHRYFRHHQGLCGHPEGEDCGLGDHRRGRCPTVSSAITTPCSCDHPWLFV